MSNEKKDVAVVAVSSDLALLNELRSAPASRRRGGDPESGSGVVREFVRGLLGGMIQSLQTDDPCVQLELTVVVKALRAKAINVQGEEFIMPDDVVLKDGERWKLFPNTLDLSDRYREIRNNITNYLKTRKEFKVVKGVWSEKEQKKLSMITLIIKPPKTPKAPKAA